jgi:hypothetical protein
MKAPITIDEAMHDPKLLGAALGDTASWQVWSAVAKASYGLRLTATERTAFDKVAGGRNPPTRKVREFVGVASRRSGKGRIAAALATYESAIVDHRQHLSPGETGVCATISPTKAQSTIILNYCRGYFESSPLLRTKVKDITQDEIRLKNGTIITTLVNDFRSLRGRTLLFAALDEAAFLRDDQSSTPDIEAARALRPGLSTTDGLLAILSSPYSRRGLLHQRYRDYYGTDSDDTLVVSGPSQVFNPTLDAAMIEAERAADPAAAESEWFGLFRSDLAAFLSDDLIDAAVDHGRPLELPPREDVVYQSFGDVSAGRSDATAICIGHSEGETFVVDVVRGHPAPHNPADVVAELCALARQYRCTKITADNFSGEWAASAVREAGLEFRRCELPKSALYLEGLSRFTRGQVRLPNHTALLRELRLLERRTMRSGKDAVDHPAHGGHDDHCNVVFGAMWLCRPAIIDRNAIDLGSPYSSGRESLPNPFAGETGDGPTPEYQDPTPWLMH